jgi:hypothetical protein
MGYEVATALGPKGLTGCWHIRFTVFVEKNN